MLTIPQVGGMYADLSRKKPQSIWLSATILKWTTRPLSQTNLKRLGQTVYVSATPAALEMERSSRCRAVNPSYWFARSRNGKKTDQGTS